MDLGSKIFEIGGIIVVLLMIIVLGALWHYYHKKKEDIIPLRLLICITLLTCLILTFLAFLAFDDVASTLKYGAIITIVAPLIVFAFSYFGRKMEELGKKKNANM